MLGNWLAQREKGLEIEGGTLDDLRV